MIQDPAVAGPKIDRVVEDWLGAHEDHYLDGPVTPRLAVVDLDPDTEQLVPGAEFLPPNGRTPGTYRADTAMIESPNFIQTSVFGTVLRTMYLFEESDTLGRRVSWGFDAPQLFVVPRAGWKENAFYERRSHSLQFFAFRSGGRTVYTSLSRDIVAHEAAHALLDGIAPDLYDALDPQSLALHEAIADLVAMLIAFRSPRLREAVLGETNGSIEKSTEFSSIGEEFGRAIDPNGKAGYLRNLLNDATLEPDMDPAGEPEEHELSQVLTGVLYEFMYDLHEAKKKQLAVGGKTPFEVSGKALVQAAERFKRMILRGLDYLPPGEISFGDYARAILAADQASHPRDERRQSLRNRLVRRGIVRSTDDLEVVTNVEVEAVSAADLPSLVDSDWVAYTFADRNRELLRIPEGVQFQVLPRLVVTKDYYLGPTPTRIQELLFKVRWSHVEENPPDLGGTATRRIQTGTTLVIDVGKQIVRACMKPLDLGSRRRARDAQLRRLMERGLVHPSTATDDERLQQTLGTGIEAVVIGGTLRVRNTARKLHIAKDAEDD